jgi:hypothetical protein
MRNKIPSIVPVGTGRLWTLTHHFVVGYYHSIPAGQADARFSLFSDLSDVLTSVGGHRKIDTCLARNNCVGFK